MLLPGSWLTSGFCGSHVAPGDSKATGVTGRQVCSQSTACARPARGVPGRQRQHGENAVRCKCAAVPEEGGMSEQVLGHIPAASEGGTHPTYNSGVPASYASYVVRWP